MIEDLHEPMKVQFANFSLTDFYLYIPGNITVLLVLSASCGMSLSLHDSTVPLCSRRTLLMVAVDTITIPLMFVRFTVNTSNCCGGWLSMVNST